MLAGMDQVVNSSKAENSYSLVKVEVIAAGREESNDAVPAGRSPPQEELPLPNVAPAPPPAYLFRS
jgi:hypothetical protein